MKDKLAHGVKARAGGEWEECNARMGAGSESTSRCSSVRGRGLAQDQYEAGW